ncbi:MAG: tetratricopeptide repeat protein [Usitatibacter sp.]
MIGTPEDAAFALFESGRLAEAEDAWREILSRKPDDPDALHILGYIVATTGRIGEGLKLLDRAVQRAPRVAGIRSNRAMILSQAGRNDEAERDIRRALDLDPRLPAALYLLGNIRTSQGRFDEAVTAYRRALAIDPRMAPAHQGLGSALLSSGDSEGARSSFEAALAIDPLDAETVHRLAAWWQTQGDEVKAEAGYRRALQIAPHHAASLNELGLLLREAGRDAESDALFERAVEALPGDADLLNNLGVARLRADRFEEAIAIFERVLELRPGFVPAIVNLANAHQERGDFEAAAARYDEASQLAPQYTAGPYGRSQVALRAFDFAKGWEGYELRAGIRSEYAKQCEASLPRLTLEDLDGVETVTIWTEQGLGDQLLYSTLLSDLEARRVKFVVEVDSRLVPAYRRRFPAMTVVAAGAGAPSFDGCTRQLPLGSLPRLFRNDLGSFARQPVALLSADPQRVEAARQYLGEGRWIGVSWRSLQKGERGVVARRKSMPMEAFSALIGVGGARLLDLQYGDLEAERAAFDAKHPGAMTRLEGLDTRDDLEGVLAAIEACDRVITTSNALAHLAGAIGKPTWLLLLEGRPPFHYWVPRPDRRSLWYPSVEIIGAPEDNTWVKVVAKAVRRLESESPLVLSMPGL